VPDCRNLQGREPDNEEEASRLYVSPADGRTSICPHRLITRDREAGTSRAEQPLCHLFNLFAILGIPAT